MRNQKTSMQGPEVLLAIWGDQINHTVTELFVVLARYCVVLLIISPNKI